MKTLLFLLATILIVATASSETAPSKEESLVNHEDGRLNNSLNDGERYDYGRGMRMTCDKYPRVCRVRGSKGPDCCGKTCVNVWTDRNNCGRCGHICKHSEICCRGKCVNPMWNKYHCGGCGNICHHGDSCVYGICSYS